MPRLSVAVWEQIINRYKAGELPTALGIEFGCSGPAVCAMLRRRGIGRHSRSYVYRAASGCHHNEHAFDVVTPESAYWIGFLMADGTVTSGNTMAVVLSERDVGHLEKLKSFLGASNKIVRKISGRYSEAHSETYSARFAVRSPRLCAALANYGVRPRKTNNATACDVLASNRDFWRGVIDGDGYVSLHSAPSYFNRHPKVNAWSKPRLVPRIELVGSQPLLEQFCQYVKSIVPGTKVSVKAHKSIYRVSLGGDTARTIASALYSNASTVLDRKANAAKNLELVGAASPEPAGHSARPTCGEIGALVAAQATTKLRSVTRKSQRCS
jgi:hypothetical protein